MLHSFNQACPKWYVVTSIYSLDTNLCYITFNKTLKDSLKNLYNLEIQPGDNVYSFLEKIDPVEANGWKAKYARALLGETVKFEKEFTVADFYSCINFAIYPIREKEEVVGLSCFAIDVTTQKKDIVQKEKMLSDILKRNRNLEQFSFIVSHNLRAPLTTILGLTTLLAMNDHTEEDATLIAGISTSVKKLDTVIHDLNDVLKTASPFNENRSIVSFSSLLSDIQLSIGNLLSSEEVRINSDFSAVDEILTLKSYLHSIFFNLISNSIKYKCRRVKPVIDISSVKTEKTIELIFKDNGLGINLDKNADKLFGLYNRFHDHVEGKGMGLYMVKSQVEGLGGVIRVESKENQGTTFTIVFQTA